MTKTWLCLMSQSQSREEGRAKAERETAVNKRGIRYTYRRALIMHVIMPQIGG